MSRPGDEVALSDRLQMSLNGPAASGTLIGVFRDPMVVGDEIVGRWGADGTKRLSKHPKRRWEIVHGPDRKLQ